MATSAVKIPYIEAAAPSTPASGQVVTYAKTDGLMYSKDDAGTETLMSAGGGGFDEDLLPWTIQLLPFLFKSTTGFALGGNDDAQVLGIVAQSSGTVNDVIRWDIVLAAGTWTFKLYHTQSTNRGIYTVSLAGASQGTIDGYNASPTNNVTSSITGITVATSQKYEFALTMATKNASSSSFFASFAMCQWHRTA